VEHLKNLLNINTTRLLCYLTVFQITMNVSKNITNVWGCNGIRLKERTSIVFPSPINFDQLFLHYLSVVDRGLEPRRVKGKTMKLVFFCLSAKNASLRRKCKGNQDNVSEWSDMSTFGLLFEWACTIKIPLS